MSQSQPWLPLKATIGLILTGMFIVGGTAAGIVLANNVQATREAEAKEWAATSVDMTIALSEAMMSDDREAFVAFGANAETQEKLARFWDDTKKIGWNVGGAAKTAIAVEGLDHKNSITFIMQLGTDARQRSGDGALAVTTNIDYKVTFSDNNQKLSSLEPVILMPWDTAEGSYVEKRDHITLYGFADESELIASSIDRSEATAATVIATSRLSTEGDFGRASSAAIFLTANQDRYTSVIHRDWGGELGSGPDESPDFQNSSAGITIQFPNLVREVDNEAFNAAALLGRGSFIAINASSPGVEVEKTVAHELTHLLFLTNKEPDIISFAGSTNVVVEGYARYMDSIAMGRLDDLRGPKMRAIVAATPLETLLADEAFRSAETAADAYLASASFLYFVDQYSDHDLYWLISKESGYDLMPFTQWTTYDEGITYQDWLAWVQAS